MKKKLFTSAFITLFALWSVPVYPQGDPLVPDAAPLSTQAPVTEEAPVVKTGNVTVNFKNADIKAVLEYFSEVSGVDIVPSPDVSGPVTLKLTDKPWQTALDILVKNYGYAYEREGDIIRVVTLSSLKLEELSTEVIPLNYASAEVARDAVSDMLTERGKLTFDSRINALIVTDLATNIYKVKQIVQDIDKRTPQIMIEAKIIETTLGKDERLGINWNLVAGASGARRPITAPFQVFGAWQTATHHVFEYLPRAQPATSTSTTPAGGGVAVQTTTAQDFPTDWTAPFPFASKDEFTFGTLDFTQFSMVMEYLKSRSDTDIISSPRITTLNNKEAKMFVGKVYNYISEIEEKESESGSERWTYKIEKEEIGIRLLVTPQVSDIGDIRVKLKPEIKDVIGFQQVTQFFSLPIFTTREAETQVLMRNGDTIFIGGLIKENINEYEKKFPLLGDILGGIPYLGNLFKYETETKSKTELVIFLTVHLVTSSEMTKGFAMQGMSEIKVPMGGDEDFAKNQIKDIEKETVRSRKKRHEPLFDFRKKK